MCTPAGGDLQAADHRLCATETAAAANCLFGLGRWSVECISSAFPSARAQSGCVDNFLTHSIDLSKNFLSLHEMTSVIDLVPTTDITPQRSNLIQFTIRTSQIYRSSSF